MPLFSVIIPTYNRSDLLEQTLKSVWQQTFRDFEVIVVDDGSTDSTNHVLDRFSDRLISVRQENLGPSAARNTGVRLARGEYLAFLDSDDLWFPWTLETYARAISEHAAPTCVMGAWSRFSSQEELAVQKRSLIVRKFPDFLKAGQTPLFWGTNIAVRAVEMIEVGGFCEAIRVFEDQDVGLRLGTCPNFVKIEQPITVAYRETPGSLTTSAEKSLEGILYVLDQEQIGAYPGGASRRHERRRYITFTVRSLSLGLLRTGHLRGAGRLYCRTMVWHVLLGRLRYLVGFPIACCVAALKTFLRFR